MKKYTTPQGSGYFDPAHPELGVIPTSEIRAHSGPGTGDFSQSGFSGGTSALFSGTSQGALNLPNRGNVEPLPVSNALALAMALRNSASSFAYGVMGSALLVPVWLGLVAFMNGKGNIVNLLGDSFFGTDLPVAAFMLLLALFTYVFGGILSHWLRLRALARTAPVAIPPAQERAELSKSWLHGLDKRLIAFVILAGLGAIATSIVCAAMHEWLWLLGCIGVVSLLAITFINARKSLKDPSLVPQWIDRAELWPETTSRPFAVTQGNNASSVLKDVRGLLSVLLAMAGFVAIVAYFVGGNGTSRGYFLALTGIPDYQVVFFAPLAVAPFVLISSLLKVSPALRQFRAWQRNPYRAYESDSQKKRVHTQDSPEIAAARRILTGHPFSSFGNCFIALGSTGLFLSLWLNFIALAHSPLAPVFSGSFSLEQPLHLLGISPIILALSCAIFFVGILVHAAASKARVAHDSAILRAFPTIDPIKAMRIDRSPDSESPDTQRWARDGEPWNPALTAELSGYWPQVTQSLKRKRLLAEIAQLLTMIK